jgi:hypothetical protein
MQRVFAAAALEAAGLFFTAATAVFIDFIFPRCLSL